MAMMSSSSFYRTGASLTRFCVNRVRTTNVKRSTLWPGQNFVHLLCSAYISSALTSYRLKSAGETTYVGDCVSRTQNVFWILL